MRRASTSILIRCPKWRRLIRIEIEKVTYFDSDKSAFEGYLNLAICSYASRPKLCVISNTSSYAYFTDDLKICLQLTNEGNPQTSWQPPNYDLIVNSQEQQDYDERNERWAERS